jgi:MFS superfamily sulfate permease-like transporter
LATFTSLMCIGLLVSATLLMLANVFKLANLGAFLPSSVLSGFFAAVAVLMETLAFKVDTSGKTFSQVFLGHDVHAMVNAIIHHVPSIIIAVAMKHLGPKNPFYVVSCVAVTIVLFYVYMLCTGASFEDMVERGWFWSHNELSSNHPETTVGFESWAPPIPLGWLPCLLEGQVHWGAVRDGMSTTMALAFLYMIRCSLHGAALRKNVTLMERHETRPIVSTKINHRTTSSSPRQHRRHFSDSVDIENLALSPSRTDRKDQVVVIKTKQTQHSLKEILTQYAWSQYMCALVGGMAVCPSVGASSTMYSLGAESVAPQLGSVILLSIFYLTNFQLVCYVPKPAFSSMLILAFLDMIDTWFIKSFQKTKEKSEWMVVPIIVVSAFSVGLLSAVFLGIAMSTFLFVASFYRSGIVKYVANGISIRSTIERPINIAKWLDQNGDLMQILVLQNYLFFGNASSINNYVSSMFLEVEVDDPNVPPIPMIVVLDFSLVSGMDGSAVDVIADIGAVCSTHDCKLFLSGLSPSIRQTLHLGGITPGKTKDRTERKIRFFADLDTAIGKAEDSLVKYNYDNGDISNFLTSQSARPLEMSGFRQCLCHIDQQVRLR